MCQPEQTVSTQGLVVFNYGYDHRHQQSVEPDEIKFELLAVYNLERIGFQLGARVELNGNTPKVTCLSGTLLASQEL